MSGRHDCSGKEKAQAALESGMNRVIRRIISGEDAARIRSNIAGVMSTLWMVVIFFFSAQNKEESDAVSGGMRNRVLLFGDWLLHLNIDEETLAQLALTVERAIRKSAHMAEFGILAVLLYIWIGRWQLTRARRFWIAAGLTAFYACTDEFHQLFVPGRAGLISDVLIDSCGAVLGLLVFLLLQRLFARLRGRRRHRASEGAA